MQKEITGLKRDCSQMKGSLESKDKRIILLEGQLKSKEQKFMNDLKLAQRHNSELKSELDSKSNTIAYLTTQLHQLKTLSQKADKNIPDKANTVPAPPREGTPSRRTRRRTTPSPSPNNSSSDSLVNLSSHQLDTSELILQASLSNRGIGRSLPTRPAQSHANPARPAHGHSAARRERELHLINRQRPTDYKEIINAQQSTDRELIPRPPADPLPPISSSKNARKIRSNESRCELNVDSRKGRRSTSHGGEITEVVVDPLSSPERTWKKAQNSSRQ